MDYLTFIVCLLLIFPIYFIIGFSYIRIINFEKKLKQSTRNKKSAEIFIKELIKSAYDYSGGNLSLESVIKYVETLANNVTSNVSSQ